MNIKEINKQYYDQFSGAGKGFARNGWSSEHVQNFKFMLLSEVFVYGKPNLVKGI